MPIIFDKIEQARTVKNKVMSTETEWMEDGGAGL